MDTTEHKAFGIALAREAGEIMLKHFSLNIDIEIKDDSSPVTIADKEINALVIRKISEKYPTHNIITEEAPAIQKDSRYSWVCDPIDGTMPYSAGIPLSTFSLALCEDGEPILGVVYDPILKRLFTAEKGKGAYLNETIRMKVNTLPKIAGSYASITPTFGKLVEHLIVDQKVANPTYWSFVYQAMMVALGKFTVAVLRLKKPWDVAALALIVKEGGGKVTDIDGNEQKYDREVNGCIASNGLVHDEILELIRKFKDK